MLRKPCPAGLEQRRHRLRSPQLCDVNEDEPVWFVAANWQWLLCA